MTQPTLLLSFAHPDDESFVCGGTIARCANAGIRVVLSCTTRGEAGEIASAELATAETLGAVREKELQAAAATLGISQLYLHDYRDSGMPGAPTNSHPNAFMRAPIDEVVAKLVKIIRAERPHVVITFEPNGGYAHPDHIAIHHATVAAVNAANTTTYQPDLGAPWEVGRLFYTSMPRQVFLRIRDEMAQRGMEIERFAALENQPSFTDGVEPLTFDISDTVETKWAAMRQHRTQISPDNFIAKLPDDILQKITSQEQFVLAPPYRRAVGPLSDLFDGLEIA